MVVTLVYVNAIWDNQAGKLTIAVTRAGHSSKRAGNMVRAATTENEVLTILTALVNLLLDRGYHVHYGRKIYKPSVEALVRSVDDRLGAVGSELWRREMINLARDVAAKESVRKAKWAAIRAARRAAAAEAEIAATADEFEDLEVPGPPVVESTR
jgi:hypothetical protein